MIFVAGDSAVHTSEETGSEARGRYGIIVVSVSSNDVAKKGGATVLLYAGGSSGVPTFALEDVGTTYVVIEGHSDTIKSELTIVARLAGSDTTAAFGDTIFEATLVTTVDEVVTGTANIKIIVARSTLVTGKSVGEESNPGGSSGRGFATFARKGLLEVPTKCGGRTLVLS